MSDTDQLARLVDLRLTPTEATTVERLIGQGWHLAEVLDSIVQWRRDGHPA